MPEDRDLDLERCVTDSIKQNTSCKSSVSFKASQRCNIAVQHLDGRAILISANIKEEVNGNLVLSSATRQISQALTKRWYQRLIGKLFMGCVVGTARISKLGHGDLQKCCSGDEEASILECRVYLVDFVLDPLLTEAFLNPNLLLRSAAYPFNVDTFSSSSADNDEFLGKQPKDSSIDVDGQSTRTCVEHDDQEIVVIRQVIDKAKVAWLLILLLLFSPALGIVVGVCSHNAEVGIAVSAGIFALASFVQGLAAWIQG